MKLKDILNNAGTNPFSPYIIAEAGVNHEGSMELAKRLIDEAAEGGAQAIKFQTYKAETLASKNSPSYWDTTKEASTSQYELFKRYDKFWKGEYEQLKIYCDEAGVEFMSTPFDVESAHFLNDLMDVVKISSSDLTNLPFIEILCSFNKPIILSTGASYLWEVERTVECIKAQGNALCLMHCVLNYPTENKNANLGMIKHQIAKFPNTIPGYSDHTLPGEMDVLITSMLLGAQVIEKHFTHDKTLPGNDHYHAMDKEDLKRFWEKVSFQKEIIGDTEKKPLATEEISRQNARRSLVAKRDMSTGHTITRDDLTWKRPGVGISPADINDVIGKQAKEDITADDILYPHMIS